MRSTPPAGSASTGLLVRPAAAPDLTSVVALLGQLHDPPDATADEAVWAAILAHPGRTILVAEVDGEIVGTADVLVVANLTRGARPWMQVENVAVDASCRRRGIGRALMTEAERIAHATGCYKLQLLSASRREAAHAFYASLGFEPTAQGLRRYLDQP